MLLEALILGLWGLMLLRAWGSKTNQTQQNGPPGVTETR